VFIEGMWTQQLPWDSMILTREVAKHSISSRFPKISWYTSRWFWCGHFNHQHDCSPLHAWSQSAHKWCLLQIPCEQDLWVGEAIGM